MRSKCLSCLVSLSFRPSLALFTRGLFRTFIGLLELAAPISNGTIAKSSGPLGPLPLENDEVLL